MVPSNPAAAELCVRRTECMPGTFRQSASPSVVSNSVIEPSTLEGKAEFDSIAPYIGVGLDFRIANTLGLSMDLGVLSQGSPSISTSATGPIASDPAFQSDLEAERQELENELDDYDLYPVLSIGLNFNF